MYLADGSYDEAADFYYNFFLSGDYNINIPSMLVYLPVRVQYTGKFTMVLLLCTGMHSKI